MRGLPRPIPGTITPFSSLVAFQVQPLFFLGFRHGIYRERVCASRKGPAVMQPSALLEGTHTPVFLTEPDTPVAKDAIEVEGIVTEVLPNTNFRVQLENDHEILAYLSGKMRRHYIRVLAGDRVKVEMSPYDLSRGRLTYRYK